MFLFRIPPILCLALFSLACSSISREQDATLISIKQGDLKGSVERAEKVRSFKGIPFAAAPVGDFRWQPPQEPASWQGIRKAEEFGYKCMQNPIYSDMQFRDAGSNEDCLFLNVWTPLSEAKDLPVLVYFYGGGFTAGDGSEKRYDGASMAEKGIVTVTVNYRMGVFGLFTHPQLSAESGYGGSGNYTFMDQAAALKWVNKNIHSFGGDPKRVTIAGESAGSFSVSALMASPISRKFISGAIGESGSFLAGRLNGLKSAEKRGVQLADAVLANEELSGEEVIAALKNMSAQTLLDKTTEANFLGFTANVDNYVIPKTLTQMYTDGEYAQVPLLAGNNSQEGGYGSVLKGSEPTVENYKLALKKRYPIQHKVIFDLYPAADDEQVKDAAQAIASDAFISLSTWNWMDLVSQTNPQATYFYNYTHVRPLMKDEYWDKNWKQTPARGATHSAEIEYALGNLDVNNLYHWQQQDYQVSNIIQQYFINFIKTGNPNGEALPSWPQFKQGKQMVINIKPYAEDIDYLHSRYTSLNKLRKQP